MHVNSNSQLRQPYTKRRDWTRQNIAISNMLQLVADAKFPAIKKYLVGKHFQAPPIFFLLNDKQHAMTVIEKVAPI